MLSELLSAFVLLSQGAVSTGPAFSSDQFTLDSGHGGDNIDIITGSQFYGLTTFAHVPYANCFIDSEAEKVSYDIAFLGAPFDTAVTGRPGARFGPEGVRQGSARMRPDAAWSIYTRKNNLLSWAKILDCGDVLMTFLDNTVALKQLQKAHEVISSRPANSTDISTVPRIITFGGDHTTTLPALRSAYEKWGPVSVIHFDSHIDTWEPKVLGGYISEYAGVNHGTFLDIAYKEGLLLDSSIHVGIRAPIARPVDDIENDVRCGFEIITARDIDRIGASGIIERVKQRVGNSRVYITVDIDVLDPAFAPGTGTAEPGGFSTRELLTIIDGLSGLQVIGADVAEVAPAYDNTGQATVLAAAEVVNSLLGLMVDVPVAA